MGQPATSPTSLASLPISSLSECNVEFQWGTRVCEQEQLRIISAAFSRKMLRCPIKGALTVTDGKAAGAAHTPLNHTRLCLL